MSIEEQIRSLVTPVGPLSYKDVRNCLLDKGFQKPGKGIKHLIQTIIEAKDPIDIVTALKKKIKRNNDNLQSGKGIKKTTTTSGTKAIHLIRLNEALAMRGILVDTKKQSGKKDTLVRHIIMLLDALDREDEDYPDVNALLSEALAKRGQDYKGKSLIERLKLLLDDLEREDNEEEEPDIFA